LDDFEPLDRTAAARTKSPPADRAAVLGGGDGGGGGGEAAAAVDVPVGVAGVKEMRRSTPAPFVYDTHGRKVLREVWEARRAEAAAAKRADADARHALERESSERAHGDGGGQPPAVPARHAAKAPTACGELRGPLRAAYDDFVATKQAQVAAAKEAAATLRGSRLAWLGAAFEEAVHNGGGAGGSGAGDAAVAVQWPLYACAEGLGDVVVTVEARTAWSSTSAPAASAYSRHDPQVYAKCAASVRLAVAQKLAGRGLRYVHAKARAEASFICFPRRARAPP
jgi:hypothetical protein